MAAGQGFKTFTTGEVLTAADVNGYLMQGINVFASSAARAAAITSPQEGQYSFLKDTNALEYYDGAAWVGAPVGDITAVTAGKGLTGGGSSGDVTVSLGTTAKGDLVAGSGTTTAAVLSVGANNTVLTADSTTATGLKWATAGGGGKVLQVVTATYSTEVTTSSSTYADTGLSATITPTLNTSKVLVMVFQNGIYKTDSNASNALKFRLLRSSTELLVFAKDLGFTNSAIYNYVGTSAASYLDSPATTSATTYKTQFGVTSGAGTVGACQEVGASSTILLMEIGA